MNEEITIRQSQVLFPFGVGAILDYQGQSFIACDITRWTSAVQFHEERLENILSVNEFRAPPRFDRRHIHTGVPFYRFPKWMFCGKCRRMRLFLFKDETGQHPECLNCGHLLTPMRFVLACFNGHLSDVPWDYWAHRNHNRKCEDRRQLEFRMKENVKDVGGLGSLVVRCLSCGSSNDLEVLMRPNLKLKCQGNHPWRFKKESVQCEAETRVIQRGASNLRYDFSVEAISIPPWTDFDYWGSDAQKIRQHRDFLTLIRRIDTPVFEILAEEIADDLDLDVDLVEKAAMAEQIPDKKIPPDKFSLEYEEYMSLIGEDRPHHPLDKFQKKKVDHVSYLNSIPDRLDPEGILLKLGDYIESSCLVTRLRCVRVLTGFSRISKNSENMVPVDLGISDRTWLPAIEFYGEGVFLEIKKDRIKKWANNKKVQDRVKNVLERFLNLPAALRGVFSSLPGFLPNAEFILLHTLSHLLMLRMQYVSGYSTSSIRERLYCHFSDNKNEEMSGILLFTSSGDVEGGMGGLARLGNPEYLFPLLSESIECAITCSYDPVCIESKGQGIDALNLAACHTCTLVPETSCQCRNQLLDRALIVGSEMDPDIGFFSEIVNLLEKR
ncbi:DrmB family protein [Thermodesulfobacteriota bacterium]